MNDKISKFAEQLARLLGSKMLGLLLIGSSENQDQTALSDVDLILLASNLNTAELRAIRDTVRNIDFLVDMPIIQQEELPTNPDLFQMGTHGCYFLAVLKKAQVIYGANFFASYPEPTEAAVRASVFRKVAEYTWAARRMYIESNRERSIAQNYQLSSRMMKAVKDVLWLAGQSDVHGYTAVQSVAALRSNTELGLSAAEWLALDNISHPEIRNILAANMSEDFLQARIGILEKLYALAVSLLGSG